MAFLDQAFHALALLAVHARTETASDLLETPRVLAGLPEVAIESIAQLAV